MFIGRNHFEIRFGGLSPVIAAASTVLTPLATEHFLPRQKPFKKVSRSSLCTTQNGCNKDKNRILVCHSCRTESVNECTCHGLACAMTVLHCRHRAQMQMSGVIVTAPNSQHAAWVSVVSVLSSALHGIHWVDGGGAGGFCVSATNVH